jgi:hypothetical protein
VQVEHGLREPFRIADEDHAATQDVDLSVELVGHVIEQRAQIKTGVVESGVLAGSFAVDASFDSRPQGAGTMSRAFSQS